MSTNPVLVIGSKNYSSWSLRPWLVLHAFGVVFDEILLPLDVPEFYARIRDYSPTGRVPALHDGDVRVWDSLAIAEYANERWLGGRGWPADMAARRTADGTGSSRAPRASASVCAVTGGSAARLNAPRAF